MVLSQKKNFFFFGWKIFGLRKFFEKIFRKIFFFKNFFFQIFCFGSLTKPNWWFHFCFGSLTKPNWWFANSCRRHGFRRKPPVSGFRRVTGRAGFTWFANSWRFANSWWIANSSTTRPFDVWLGEVARSASAPSQILKGRAKEELANHLGLCPKRVYPRVEAPMFD